MIGLRVVRLVVPAIGVFSLATACSRQPPAASQPAQGSAAAASTAEGSGQTVTGPVLETVDAAPYTYVRVRTPTGEIWAAAPQFPIKVGDRVVVPLEMPMKDFHSQTLNRRFPLVYFASQIGREGEAGSVAAAPRSAPQLRSAHGTEAPAAPAQVLEPMTPPPGATSIAALWANRKTLAGKPVTVRGKVVKFNAAILGQNWIHLQDGTGKAGDNSNDITVTTPETVTVSVGDTITVTGTLAIDKTLGEGYAYGALIENARVTTPAIK